LEHQLEEIKSKERMKTQKQEAALKALRQSVRQEELSLLRDDDGSATASLDLDALTISGGSLNADGSLNAVGSQRGSGNSMLRQQPLQQPQQSSNNASTLSFGARQGSARRFSVNNAASQSASRTSTPAKTQPRIVGNMMGGNDDADEDVRRSNSSSLRHTSASRKLSSGNQLKTTAAVAAASKPPVVASGDSDDSDSDFGMEEAESLMGPDANLADDDF
jgi:hypothetical protein